MNPIFNTRLSRVIVGHWPLALAPFFAAYAAVVAPPYGLSELATRVLWAFTALIMVAAGVRQTLDCNLVAMVVSVFACLSRSYVLVEGASGLSFDRRWSGAFVWTIVAVLIVLMTMATEMVRARAAAPQRAAERAGIPGAIRR